MSVRPYGGHVLVREHPRAKKSKVLELITNESNVLTGEVLQVGPGAVGKKGRVAPTVQVGEKVAFLRWHKEHQAGRAVQHALEGEGEGLSILSERDILFVYDGDIEVDT
jgi:co-chaperonin GroES (HSP10)